MRTRQHHARYLFVLAVAALLPGLASAHGPAGQEAALAPLDPALFSGWQTWVHLLVQWAHLLGLPLWLGILAAAWRFRVLALETLLFGGWAVLLLQGVTGAYNMEYSAGVPTAPSLLQWPVVGAYDFGRSYTALLGVKQGLYGLAVLVTLLVTALHVRRPKGIDRRRLCTGYAAAQIVLGVLIAVATTGVLVLHEASDVSPTPVHALGGAMGLEGQVALEQGGIEATSLGWWQISWANGELVTDGMYGAVRHPQHLGLILRIVPFLIQWSTLPTLVLRPVLIVRMD